MAQSSSNSNASLSAQTLQGLMQQASLSSQRALATKANVSRWQVQQLSQGKIDSMRLGILKQLATALDYALPDLLAAFDPNQASPDVTTTNSPPPPENNPGDVALLRQEYDRLQRQLERQAQELQQQFQTEALGMIESWLTYWPTAAKAAMDHEGFDAKKLLPLVKPIDRLIASWGVIAMGSVGEQLPYDSVQHQLARGMANPGDPVRISHVGYRQGEKLIQRVKVVPI